MFQLSGVYCSLNEGAPSPSLDVSIPPGGDPVADGEEHARAGPHRIASGLSAGDSKRFGFEVRISSEGFPEP